MSIFNYINEAKLPTFWCSGCGHGVIIKALADAFDQLELALNEIVVVTGIGCFGRSDDYFMTNALHTLHGRAIAYATGVKLANPELTVVALMGDGDAASIGGNHLIHAARRNLGILALCANNRNYGMTGGQYSPTSQFGDRSSTSRYGLPESSFDLSALVQAAGASFVARTTVFHYKNLVKYLKKGINKGGFAFVEVMEPCPTMYGKFNQLGSAGDMVQQIRDEVVPVSRWKPGSDKSPIGILCERDMQEYCRAYDDVIRKAGGFDGD
ncbi:2-oxoacid:ferredoxin oxidoreductase subunit beta [candidate division LCP-89 bacterium B3_LCP]|uniref:2-oxoacid:ferredoxin oxidoreductase subunit beta n=1 Tax=candidate division LCP-89 bacterium B3_LCP TaxID=2012998 RepID=A0A532UYN1_UNCL8|nr:MAG: 2-oxoacid:ferredoxin oxidoreductase subunit beta [candidate division LCP-89 bacterium B3_LCP]